MVYFCLVSDITITTKLLQHFCKQLETIQIYQDKHFTLNYLIKQFIIFKQVREEILTIKRYINNPQKWFPLTSQAVVHSLKDDARAKVHFQQQVRMKFYLHFPLALHDEVFSYLYLVQIHFM